MDEQTIKIGGLVEAAATQQAAVDGAIHRLEAVRVQLVPALEAAVAGAVHERLREATGTLSEAHARLRGTVAWFTWRWAGLVVAVGMGVVLAVLVVAWRLVPTRAELDGLRAQRAALQATVADLSRRGGRAKLELCGDKKRLCVRVDASAGPFGTKGDYRVIEGY